MKRVPARAKQGWCQRSGFRISKRKLVREPGTNLLADKTVSDGIYNRTKYDPRIYPARPNTNEGRPRWYAEPEPYDPADLKVGKTLAYLPETGAAFVQFGRFQLRIE